MSTSLLTKFAGFKYRAEGQFFVCKRRVWESDVANRNTESDVANRNTEPHFCVHRTLLYCVPLYFLCENRRAVAGRSDSYLECRQSQWPRGLRRRSTAASLLRSWVRLAPAALMSVSCECFVLSGRSLCDELTTRPEASYGLWCVAVCYRNLVNEEPNINQ
jgi:hypothetical protein